MLLILQSILVYGFIILVMNYYGKVAYNHQYPQGVEGIDMFANKKFSFDRFITKSYFFIPIFIFCLFSALRYQVGVDCEGYKASFYHILNWGVSERGEKEFLFVALSKMTMIFTESHYLFFFILAFLQIAPLYFALRKKSYAIIYLGLVIILSGVYFSLMNGIRQNIAACVLVATVPLMLDKKKWVWFIVVTLIASLMHKSALVFIPIGIIAYFFLKKGIFGIKVQIAILAACYILMDKIELGFLDTMFSYGEYAGYDSHSVESYTDSVITNKNFGFSSWLLFSTQIFAVFYSKRMQKLVNNEEYNVIYNMFFIATSIHLLFYNNFTIGRLNYYFVIFTPVVQSIMLFVMSHSKKIIDKQLFHISIFLFTISLLYNFYKAIASIDTVLYKFDFSHF